MAKTQLENYDEARQLQSKLERDLEALGQRLHDLGSDISRLREAANKYPPPDLSSIANRLGDVQRFIDLLSQAAHTKRARFEIYAQLSETEKSILGSGDRRAFDQFNSG